MSDIPLQLPASANVASNSSALVTFSQAEGDLMRNVPRLHPRPSQTGVNPWQLQYPSTYSQGSPAAHGPQETVQLVAQRARETLNVQRETARRALLHQQRGFLTGTRQYETVASKIKTVFWQEIMKRTIRTRSRSTMCSKKEGMLSRFSQDANQVPQDERTFLVTEVTSEVWRQDEQLYDLHQELGLQALHADDVSQHQTPEHAGLHQHLTGLVQETQQYREMFEDSRTYQSAAGPDIDRLRRRENSCEKYDVKNNERANPGRSNIKESGRPGV